MTAGANLEAGATATTSGATQAESAVTDHEVRDKTAAADETADATARARHFEEMSVTVIEGVATEGEAALMTVGAATAALPQALAKALHRAVPPTFRDHRPKPSSLIHLTRRDPRMWS